MVLSSPTRTAWILRLGAAALVALAITAVAYWPAEEADAAPTSACFLEFFSDASHTQSVGTRETHCQGGVTTTGQVTSCFEADCYRCGSGPCGNICCPIIGGVPACRCC